PMTAIFLYGTLCHLPLLEIVLGREPIGVFATSLPDHRVNWADQQNFPILSAVVGQVAHGLCLPDPSAADIARLDYYEAGFGYLLHDCELSTDNGPVPGRVYFAAPGLWNVGAPWKLDDWISAWGPITVLAAREYMDGLETIPAAVAAARYGQMLMRAGSTLRARAQKTPHALRSDTGSERVHVAARRRPYSNFFTLEERDIRFPRFDGRDSETVNRAALVGADAVTVLPYDPRRDRVLVIEQFRFGPYLRGDTTPWVLEPVAGRIDPGETPEDAAHRELAEEAGLSVRKLLPVASFYPSPGAWTEYLYSFVGLADLPDEAAGLGGLESEAEDIKSHVLSFEAAIGLLSSGEADTGPLVLTLMWLREHRHALRRDS
ncbi:MAG: NUDIX domain-containing protein, partial [Marinosulfonomonas sp.]|nr:NUDIX domain-containing protein [Marinosulfonomonas sp.]